MCGTCGGYAYAAVSYAAPVSYVAPAVVATPAVVAAPVYTYGVYGGYNRCCWGYNW